METQKKTFFGQPFGLATLFFTEMWERFSYYGMRAILLYYMYDEIANGGLGLSETTALAIMSVYGALVFMSSIVGGWIADRLLGSRQTVLYGGILIMFGHIVLGIPSGLLTLFASMILIIIGTGMLKANVSSMVGNLYAEEDDRRDAGFSIFYMGINIGSLLAPVIIGTVGQKVNYHLGFGIAAVGMLLGLIVYVIQGKSTLKSIGTKPSNPIKKGEGSKIVKSLLGFAVVVAIIFVWAGFAGRLDIDFFINFTSVLGIGLPVYYFWRMLTSPDVSLEERKKVRAYIPLFLGSIIFWSLEEQGASILAVFAQNRTKDVFFGFHVPASWYQILNPVFIVALTPFFVWLWTKMGKRQPSTVVKFSIGLVTAGLSFVMMMLPGILYGTEGRVSPWWLIISFFIMIIGEMCLSPVGLSVTTKLAPRAFESQTLAIWLLADATSQVINAQIARFYTPATESAYFGVVGLVAVVAGILLLFIRKPIQELMGNIK